MQVCSCAGLPLRHSWTVYLQKAVLWRLCAFVYTQYLRCAGRPIQVALIYLFGVLSSVLRCTAVQGSRAVLWVCYVWLWWRIMDVRVECLREMA